MLRWNSWGQLPLLEPAVALGRVPVEGGMPVALSHFVSPALRLVVCHVAGCLTGHVPARTLLPYHAPHLSIPKVVDAAGTVSRPLLLSMGSAP